MSGASSAGPKRSGGSAKRLDATGAEATPTTHRPHGSRKSLIDELVSALEAAADHNPNDAVAPAAILWADPDAQWRPVLPQLRKRLPQLLILGDHDPEQRTGPAIWLRCVIDGALSTPGMPDEATPVVYLPGVGRRDFAAAESCPAHLKPLVELQYRGVCWTQKNGRAWTVEAFLGSLDLDVARDAATRDALRRAVAALATTPVAGLAGRRLEAEDFDRLLADDLARDVLVWIGMDDGKAPPGWDASRQRAFASRCWAELGFDPDKDGALAAAERLGQRDGAWNAVWRRFAEAPKHYPGIREKLREAKPDLFAEPRSSWPQNNEEDEAALRRDLHAVDGKTPADARKRILALEKAHGERRGWVWDAPLADALEHLAALADRTSTALGGGSCDEMAALYADGAWEVDAAALAGMAAVGSAADRKAVGRVLDAIYRPWLEATARHLQMLADRESFFDPDSRTAGQRTEPGTVLLFADGLRFDVSQRLVKRLQAGRSVKVSTRWAALPAVTTTAKPAVSPVAGRITGSTVPDDFRPVVREGGQTLTFERFRKVLDADGHQWLAEGETGDPAGRAWTECGNLDKLGHALPEELPANVDNQMARLQERIGTLLEAGWREVRVVTDHGWLWLPGGLPKVDLPKYLTGSRWARCATIKGNSAVDVPTVPWRWNAAERVALAPGIACFREGHHYAHGGLSLQESLTPVLEVTAGAGSAGPAPRIAAVSWVGLRCRVRVEPPRPGLAVDLRQRVDDAASTVAGGMRPVDDNGSASLLVADDDLEGATAAVVVLDAGGRVVGKRPTVIGGEG